MSARSAFRRSSAALGAAGILALALAEPAAAHPDPGTGDIARCTTSCFAGPDRESFNLSPAAQVVQGGVQVVQVGAGVLAGVALAGAGLAVASRRGNRRGQAHPA